MDLAHLNHYIQYYFNMASQWAYQLIGVVVIAVIVVFGTMYFLSELAEYRRRHKDINDY
jgi:predicted PurR-regulated permease PerM